MKTNFAGIYAETYDCVYSSLNSKLELTQAEAFCGELIQNPRSVIDIGGGTGRFAVELAEKYEQVYLIEPSSDMIKIALSKVENLRNIEIINKSAEKFQVRKIADGAYLMFSVASYFATPQKFHEAMKNIFSNLSSKGYVYFDVWGNNESIEPIINSSVKKFTHHGNEYERVANAKSNLVTEIEEGFRSLEMAIVYKNLRTGKKYEESHELAFISESWIHNFVSQESRISTMKSRINPSKPNNIEVCFSLH